MFNYYIGVLKKYAVFEGRARRAEYWYFFLFNIIVTIVIAIINAILANRLSFLGVLYALAVFIPGLAVTVRRLHDTGRSGWWFLIGLVPILGYIWLLVLLVLDSNPGDNKYGPNPKGVALEVIS